MENINNISSSKEFNLKLDHGKIWLIENNVDVAYCIKTGVLWHQQKCSKRLPELMKDRAWDNQLVITSNNIHEKCGKRKFGGTATMLYWIPCIYHQQHWI